MRRLHEGGCLRDRSARRRRQRARRRGLWPGNAPPERRPSCTCRRISSSTERSGTLHRRRTLPHPLSEYGRDQAGRRGGGALRSRTSLVVRSSWLFGRGGWNFVEAILKQADAGKRELRGRLRSAGPPDRDAGPRRRDRRPDAVGGHRRLSLRQPRRGELVRFRARDPRARGPKGNGGRSDRLRNARKARPPTRRTRSSTPPGTRGGPGFPFVPGSKPSPNTCHSRARPGGRDWPSSSGSARRSTRGWASVRARAEAPRLEAGRGASRRGRPRSSTSSSMPRIGRGIYRDPARRSIRGSSRTPRCVLAARPPLSAPARDRGRGLGNARGGRPGGLDRGKASSAARRFRGTRSKTWSGLAANFVVSAVAGLALLSVRLGPAGRAAIGAVLAGAAAFALAESLETGVEDNLVAPHRAARSSCGVRSLAGSDAWSRLAEIPVASVTRSSSRSAQRGDRRGPGRVEARLAFGRGRRIRRSGPSLLAVGGWGVLRAALGLLSDRDRRHEARLPREGRARRRAGRQRPPRRAARPRQLRRSAGDPARRRRRPRRVSSGSRHSPRSPAPSRPRSPTRSEPRSARSPAAGPCRSSPRRGASRDPGSRLLAGNRGRGRRSAGSSERRPGRRAHARCGSCRSCRRARPRRLSRRKRPRGRSGAGAVSGSTTSSANALNTFVGAARRGGNRASLVEGAPLPPLRELRAES